MTRDLRDELLEAVHVDEPVLTFTAQGVRVAGRQARLKRRLAGAAAVAAVAGTAVVATALASVDMGTDSADVVDSRFAPERLAEAIEAAAVGVDDSVTSTGSPFVTSSVNAYDAQDNEISGADRDKSTVWRSEFEWSADRSLSISLFRGDGDTDLGRQRELCARSLELGAMLVCDAASESDGSISVTEVQPVRFAGGYWVWVMPGDKITPQRLAYEQTVSNIRADGLNVSATERVRAESLDQAAQAWGTTVDDLREVAMNPDLSFPEPPQGADGCAGWVVPEEADLYRCGQ